MNNRDKYNLAIKSVLRLRQLKCSPLLDEELSAIVDCLNLIQQKDLDD